MGRLWDRSVGYGSWINGCATLFFMCDVFLTEAKDPTYRSPLQPTTNVHVPSSTASSSPTVQPGLIHVSMFSHDVVVILFLGAVALSDPIYMRGKI